MGKYTIQVFTGDVLGAGTSNRIYIKLIGTISNSGPHQLTAVTGFWAGSEQTCTIESKANIGKLLLVELEAKPPAYLTFLDDDWFCSQIIVTTPEGARMLFPCHCWISCDKKLTLRDSVAMLKTQEVAPELLAHRQENLKRWRQNFTFIMHVAGSRSGVAIKVATDRVAAKGTGTELLFLHSVGVGSDLDEGQKLCLPELHFGEALTKMEKEMRLLLLPQVERASKEGNTWSIHAPGLPHIVNAQSPTDLPPEVRFSFTKEKEFLFASGTAFRKLKLKCPSTDAWNSIEDYNRILSIKTKTYEYVQNNWRKDEFFGYQFLNGLNPMIIKRCSELPEKFPVTNEMVKGFLPETSTLESEMEGLLCVIFHGNRFQPSLRVHPIRVKQTRRILAFLGFILSEGGIETPLYGIKLNLRGNIFLCDYERLKDLEGNDINKKKQYLAAPLCLLFSTQDKLIPIAIQLNQEPETGNPIFLPSDSQSDWLLAKIFVRNAEFNEHELNFHLLRTHLLGEVFTVALLRNFPACHPLFKLLIPHTRYTLQINIMARNTLVSVDGSFAKYTAIGNDSMTTFLRRAASSLTYSSLCLPDNIKERGLEKIPNYYYRDDALDLWNIIFKFVFGFVSHYYSDQDVQEDKELQAWLIEIRENACSENSQTGFPESFCTVQELAKFVTMVIFTVSAQHAAVNSGQFDLGGYMPNFPSSLRRPPPRNKGSTTKDSILATLPDVNTTVNAMAIVYVLSQDSTDRYPLGHYPEELFSEEMPKKLMTQFKNALQDLEKKIDARNEKLDLPYTYLNPRNVDNSVAI